MIGTCVCPGISLPTRSKESQTIVPGIAENLRILIWKGKLRPGEHLHQETWAASLGVSHIPFREALRILEGEGLVHVAANRGVRVAPVSAQELEEWALEFTGLMHALLPLAVRTASPERLARARAIAKELDTPRAPSEVHLEFWRLIFGACGMPRLQRLVDQLLWRMGRYFRFDGKAVLASLRDVHPTREDFIDALEAGDADGAREAAIGFMQTRKAGYLRFLAEAEG